MTKDQLLFFFRSNPNNVNEAMLCWGDVGGYVNALFFSSVTMALFDRPPAPAGEKQGNGVVFLSSVLLFWNGSYLPCVLVSLVFFVNLIFCVNLCI